LGALEIDSDLISKAQASKHLRVLKHVGLVKVRSKGQQRLYAINGKGLKPIHEWAKGFEQFWNESFDRLDSYLHELQKEEKKDGHKK